MLSFDIAVPDQGISSEIQNKIDYLIKSKGSSDLLRAILMQICKVQQTASPAINKPTHIVFAGDHGICNEDASLFVQDPTSKQVLGFLDEKSEIDLLPVQKYFELKVVDCGVDFDFDLSDSRIIDRKIRKSTRNYLHQPAMFVDEFDKAISIGAELVKKTFDEGCNFISFGQISLANRFSAAIWMNTFTGILLRDCLGCDSSLVENNLGYEYRLLRQATGRYEGDGTTIDVMRHFGGFEMVMAVSAILKAAELGMTVLIEGFVMSTCVLAASRLNKNILHYTVFVSSNNDPVHNTLLDFMNVAVVAQSDVDFRSSVCLSEAYSSLESVVQLLSSFQVVHDEGDKVLLSPCSLLW